MTRYRCTSCKGEYDDPGFHGYRYFHVCPEDTLFPRDENVAHDFDEDEKPVNVRVKKGKVRDAGGATEI